MGTSQALVSEIPTPAGTGRLHLFAAAEPQALAAAGARRGRRRGGARPCEPYARGAHRRPHGGTGRAAVSGSGPPVPGTRRPPGRGLHRGARAAAADAAGTPDRRVRPVRREPPARRSDPACGHPACRRRPQRRRPGCLPHGGGDRCGRPSLHWPSRCTPRAGRTAAGWRSWPSVAGAGIPCLVVQGERDAFGTAAELAAQAPQGVRILPAPGGDHSLRRGLDAAAVIDWVVGLLGRAVD